MSGADLQLRIPRDGTADLHLGAGVAEAAVIDTELLLDEIAVDALLAPVYIVDADVLLDEITADSSARYLINVWRGPSATSRAVHQDGSRCETHAGSPWQDGARRRPSRGEQWGLAAALPSTTGAPWQESARLRSAGTDRWECATPHHGRSGGAWAVPPRQSRASSDTWQTGRQVQDSRAGTYRHPPRQQTRPALPWGIGEARSLLAALGYVMYRAPHRQSRRIPWDVAGRVEALWPRPDIWIPPEPEPEPYRPTPDLDLRCQRDGTANLPIGRVCVNLPQGDHTIPIRRVYLMIHDIEVVRLPDRTPIHASRLNISLDADAWAWQWSGNLLGAAALEAVQPDQDGQPVTLEATIDGYTWHLLVEDWTEDREFGRRGVSVKGRGLTGWLGQPYELPASGESAAIATAQQLAAAHLPIGEGWSIDWQAPDWLVPAGAWSWQGKTPAQAIHEIAQAAGYVVRPAMSSRVLRIQPRYPVLPWDYDSATPALVVPDAAIMRLERRQAVATQANAVYVHGGEVGGVLARVRRTASAGDRVAPTASHPLITHADAARALGSRLLAGQHQQPEVRSLTLPVDGSTFPLGQVGDLLRATIGGASHHGIINAVQVEAQRGNGGVTVRQTLTLGEDTPNQWARFRRLLPGDPLLMGTVEQQHVDGTATVLLVGGGSVRVRGEAADGSTVYVRGGRIEGPAPSLSQVEIEV
jgi:hypothetical protein